jgi:hypothetical protein
MSFRLQHLALLIAAALTLPLSGCQRTHLASPLVVNHDPDDANAELEFWHALADRPLTTNDEAFHGLIIFSAGSDASKTYAERVTWLKEHGFLSTGFDRDADEAVSVGTVAQVLANMLHIKGGLTMHILGAHPRYATKELIYEKILPIRSEQQGLSGVEFVGALSRAEAYQERTKS